jgi:hypothetical protein
VRQIAYTDRFVVGRLAAPIAAAHKMFFGGRRPLKGASPIPLGRESHVAVRIDSEKAPRIGVAFEFSARRAQTSRSSVGKPRRQIWCRKSAPGSLETHDEAGRRQVVLPLEGLLLSKDPPAIPRALAHRCAGVNGFDIGADEPADTLAEGMEFCARPALGYAR